ncbi:hypothetical protein HDV06_003649 [Boothiomyces sp. JEL0866]|nr:hypothetical protein HDV06_003649 [Boothiomyces sp. JEL0866]
MPFIIYLEPTGELRKYCLDYFNSTVNLINEAHQYPPHISLTGFFEGTEIRILELIDEMDKFVDVLRKPKFNGPIKTVKSIIVPIEFNGGPFIKLQEIQELRIKRMDHISLAYLNHAIKSREFSESELNELLSTAISLWGSFPNQNWELVVYDVVKSTELGVSHQFKELKRWVISK